MSSAISLGAISLACVVLSCRRSSWAHGSSSSSRLVLLIRVAVIAPDGAGPLDEWLPSAAVKENSVGIDEEFVVVCPYCGEELQIRVESDVKGSFVQDCEVCCNPWTVSVAHDGGDRYVRVSRADGSE